MRHPLAQVIELRGVEDPASLPEHLAFLFLDVVLDVLLHDGGLRAPGLVADVQRFELAHQQVDHVVLLVALEDDVLGLRVRLELRVEDLFFDDLVEGQLALDRGEQLAAGLDSPFRRRLELREELA